MATFSFGDAARHLTERFGEYVPAWRVGEAAKTLIQNGVIEERRAGRIFVLTDADIEHIAVALGLGESVAKDGEA